ncbi:MAG: hypothetical protein K8T91_26120 [Planctomycetes bacterium]|nr:hypothetical protein [Planctomycetota bacterium]
MKFWQLVSIFRDDESTLKQLFMNPEWKQYLDWYNGYDGHVFKQNRQILDAEVSPSLAENAMRQCKLKFVVWEGYLKMCDPKKKLPPDALDAIDVFKRYGGDAIEDTLEYGSFRLPSS